MKANTDKRYRVIKEFFVYAKDEYEAETKAEDKKRFYAQLLFIAKQKGYKEEWASHTFREKFHHFPHSKMVLPIPPTNEVHNFIKHLQIKKAKSKGVRLWMYDI